MTVIESLLASEARLAEADAKFKAAQAKKLELQSRPVVDAAAKSRATLERVRQIVQGDR